MVNPERITPREAGEESARNFKQVLLASRALDHAHATIERSLHNAQDETLDAHRRSIGAWHVQCWAERMLPERAQDLARAETKAANDYQKHQGAYYTAALAEATLDGIEIVR